MCEASVENIRVDPDDVELRSVPGSHEMGPHLLLFWDSLDQVWDLVILWDWPSVELSQGDVWGSSFRF